MDRRSFLLGVGAAAATLAGDAAAQTGVWGTAPYNSSRVDYTRFMQNWAADTRIQNVYVRDGTTQVVAVDRFLRNGATVFSYIGRNAQTGAYSIFSIITHAGQTYGAQFDGYAYEQYVDILRSGQLEDRYEAQINSRTAAFAQDPCFIGSIIPADPYSGQQMQVRQVTRVGSRLYSQGMPWREMSVFAIARGCTPGSRRSNMWSPNG